LKNLGHSQKTTRPLVSQAGYGSARASYRCAPNSLNNVTSNFFSAVNFLRMTSGSTWGRQICFLPRAPSNLVTPLITCANKAQIWTGSGWS